MVQADLQLAGGVQEIVPSNLTTAFVTVASKLPSALQSISHEIQTGSKINTVPNEHVCLIQCSFSTLQNVMYCLHLQMFCLHFPMGSWNHWQIKTDLFKLNESLSNYALMQINSLLFLSGYTNQNLTSELFTLKDVHLKLYLKIQNKVIQRVNSEQYEKYAR